MKRSLLALAGAALFAGQAHAQVVRKLVPDHPRKLGPNANALLNLPPSPVNGADSCTSADVLPPSGGTFAFNNASATSGPQGQTTTLGGECNIGCTEYGATHVTVPKDVWFSWTAPSSGRVRISSCGAGTVDTKVAVYNVPCASIASTCLACSDDYHYDVSGLLDSAVLFSAVASTTYLIQVGNSSFAPTASITGSLNLTYVNLVNTGIWDNGNIDNALGVTNAGDGALMMQGFKAPAGSVTVPSVKVNWYPGGVPANAAVTIAIYDDPNDDQNPIDCVLLATVSGVASPALNTFNTYTFASPVAVSGDYFVAVSRVDPTGTEYPWSVCGETCEQHANSSWFATRTGAAFDLGTVGGVIPSAGQTMIQLSAMCAGFATTDRHDVWGIRTDQVVGPTNTSFAVYCSGDGTDAACPCNNLGLPGRGCDNTVASGGAVLSSSGIASIAADSLVMNSNFAVPFGPGLYYEGNARALPVAPFGITFGNGLRCASGTTNRLEIRFADAGGASNTTVSLKAFGAAVAGTTYHYQLWYRDTGNVGVCAPGAGFNLSNAISLTWGL